MEINYEQLEDLAQQIETSDEPNSDFIESLILNNKLDELYAVMTNTVLETRYESELDKHENLLLPDKYVQVKHPEEFAPVRFIRNFIAKGGADVWMHLQAEDYTFFVEQKIISNIERLQHPVTGNTIFHENVALLNLYTSYQGDILYIPNWLGETVNDTITWRSVFETDLLGDDSE